VDGGFNPYSSFLDVVRQDPILSRVKLIAEPWDIGPDGYQLGLFPPGWAEWNDRYRDTVRRFWKGEPGTVAELASRLTGSSDIFDRLGRRPWASINFVTAHDGFTLDDLVSYNEKHNLENGEHNHDGTDQNHSWNCGVEGETEDAGVLMLRARQKRNILATLLLSQGTPMLLAGDEFGRSAYGNNNAYCQDNELNWLDWSEVGEEGEALHAFVRALLRLRSEHVVFRRGRFFLGKPTPGTNVKDITWLRPDRAEKTQADWEVSYSRCLSFVISGEPGEYHLTAAGIAEPDDTFLVIMNAGEETIDYILPDFDSTDSWRPVIDTFRADGVVETRNVTPGEVTPVSPRSIQVFIRQSRSVGAADL
jgi:glycogen operon protein